ncbi:S-layer homology domain-containing protein [Patescibacteria group bacterium]|nr:S-layer homology domain-containing protein [Patescibacteria group bacterium]
MRIRIFSYSIALVTAGILLGVGGTGTAAIIFGSDVFPDVRTGMYYDDAIGELSSVGIINGYDNGNFGPDDFVTRGQVAVLMQRLRDDMVSQIVAQESSDSSSSLAASLTGGTEDDEDTDVTTTVQAEPTEAGAMRFTIDHYSVDEESGMARISVVRTGGRKGAVTVDYTIAAGTATAGEDYEVVSGTLSFADSETSITFVVRILDDDLEEGDETITVALSEPTGGATITTPSTAVLTIKDDEVTASSGDSNGEAVISFGALGYDAVEDGETIAITVERSNDTGTASVNFATSDGTASNSNYTPTSGTLSFAAGESRKTFTIDVKDNNDINGNKTVNLTLSGPIGVVLGTSSALLTIVDDELASFGSGSIKFARSMYEATEHSEKAVIEVTRAKGTNGIVTVEYSTNGGTAVAGYDYEVTSGILTFQSGESKKSFIVPLIKDELNDSGERVNLKIENPTNGAVLMSPTTATLEIQ